VPEPLNPYEPPLADLDEIPYTSEQGAHAEALRRAHVGWERAIKRVSWLNITLAFVWLPAALGTLAISALLILRQFGFDFGGFEIPPTMPKGTAFVGLTVFHVGSFVLNIALVIGLRRFRPWARWTEVVLALVFLGLCLIYAVDVLLEGKPLVWLLMTSLPGALLFAGVLFVLLSPKS
jgi:hypothetical protein